MRDEDGQGEGGCGVAGYLPRTAHIMCAPWLLHFCKRNSLISTKISMPNPGPVERPLRSDQIGTASRSSLRRVSLEPIRFMLI